MGKSAVALQVIHSTTGDGIPVLLISEEMSALVLGKRSLEYLTALPEPDWKDMADEVEEHIDGHFAVLLRDEHQRIG